MKDMLTVRPYAPGDADATVDIFLRAIREVASKDYDQAQIDAWAKVEDRGAWARARASGQTWIVQREGVPIGFAGLEPDGLLNMMFVHPDHRSFGAASLLLATVEAEAKKQGLGRIFTEASLTARAFFERRGFVVLASQRVERRGQILENFRMEKALSVADPGAAGSV